MDETNPTPQPVVVSPTPEPPAPKKGMNTWVSLVIAVLVLGALAAGAYWLKTKAPQPTTNQTQTPTPSPTPAPQTYTEPLVSGLVDWNYPTQSYLNVIKTDSGSAQSSFGQYYDVGVFKSGKYQGSHLVVANFPCSELCSPVSARVVVGKGDSDYTILKKYSDPLDNIDTVLVDMTKFKIDPDTVIPDLNIPESISDTKLNVQLTRGKIGGYSFSYTLFNATNLKPVYFDSKVGEVYTTPDDPKQVGDVYTWDGFYVKAPDWNVIVFAYTPNFVKSDGTVHITWNNGTKVVKEYVYTDRTGCGSSNYGSIVRGVSVEKDLVKAGTTDLGDTIYEFKDTSAAFLKDIYDNQYYPYNSPKLSYAEFIANHPVFFTLDPFGRLFRFANNDFQPQAECGKPVIYLYPTKAENVSVKLSPTGGFSYTEPDYANGWNVLAQPNGQLTNLADNKTYPYLFWEGRSSDIYSTPDKGFVVKQSDVHNLLNQKLALLGLNPKETSDFEAYWEPYMQSAPYYFVTFMGNSVMDRIAPLQISPKPDTIIRILMDFKPLEKPIAVQGFDIKTPARNGFTVVEWGGVKP